MLIAHCQYEAILGVTGRALGRFLLVTIPGLVVEQLVASVLIVPKHSSSSRSSPSTAMLGLKLYLAGLGVQKVLVVYMSAVTFVLIGRLKAEDIVGSRTKTTAVQSQTSTKWPLTMWPLIFSFAAIATRVAYRIVELSGVVTGHLLVLMHHEVFFYAFECLPVLAVLGVWAILGFEGLPDHPHLNTRSSGPYLYQEIHGELENYHDTQTESGDIGR